MRKPNKFRNNNNNNYSQAYSLNYKFDSNSIAGKISGTALDLIKKYNELAKDAQNNNDYVTAEVFRQYAEHYRKIVTDINEKKNNNSQQNPNQNQNQKKNNPAETESAVTVQAPQAEKAEEAAVAKIEEEPKKSKPQKEFKIIEISEAKKEQAKETSTAAAKPKRTVRKKAVAAE